MQVVPAAPDPLHQFPPPVPAPTAQKEDVPKAAQAPKLLPEDIADKGTPKSEGNDNLEAKKPEKGPIGQGESAKEVPNPKEGGNSGGASNGGNGGKAEDPLTANSAGSAASRHGGSIYDVIVQVCFCFLNSAH